MASLIQKQLLGGAGAASAVAVVLICWANASFLLDGIPVPADDTASRLAFAAGWLLVPGWCLLVGVFGAASRGFYADAIDGTRTPSAHALEINLRYNQNTIEQTILAAIAWLGLAVAMPRDQLYSLQAWPSCSPLDARVSGLATYCTRWRGPLE